MSLSGGTAGAARRWPSWVAAATAAVLAIIVLPNGLRVPQDNPTASAEYAPVPGDADAGAANFSETNAATSAGIGAGGEGEGLLPGMQEPPPPPLRQFDPRNKDCVYVQGVARQTEDPLSPPCVPFFEGDNGGSTFRGVDRDEIRVVLYNDRCCNGSLNEPWKHQDEDQCNSPYPEECANTVRTVKAFLRYFNNRYQTYGRQVKLYAQKSSGNLGGACGTRQADASNAVQEWDPFAAISFAQGGQNCYIEEMAEHGVPVFGLNEDAEQHIYEDSRPYAYGFLPTQEVQMEWSASFICNKLATGEDAIHARDPVLQASPRKFGFIKPEGDSRGTELRVQSDLLLVELKRQCGFEFDMIEEFVASRTAGGSDEAPGIMSKFKQNGITTVVCYCIPRQTELTAPTMMNAASSAAYFPEWYWDPASQMERAVWQREYGDQKQVSFGATYWWRAPSFREQDHYQAYLREEPGSVPAAYWSMKLYYLFMNLFSGIQAAGPNLTPESVERGMFTFNNTRRENPWTPVGGFGPYNDNAVSNYTFLDTAMAVWWDPLATPPGGREGEGCMRVAQEGLRFYAGEWTKGSRDLFRQGDPCTSDLYKDSDIQTPA